EVKAEIGKAEDVLARAEVLARDQGCQIETDLLQAREVAPAIVDEAVERQIGLILLGVNYRTRFGEFCLSEIVPYVLQNAPCQVIIFQQRSV
ncbi:MAG: universal stress protein, partial [Dehalococcoidales bacterium]